VVGTTQPERGVDGTGFGAGTMENDYLCPPAGAVLQTVSCLKKQKIIALGQGTNCIPGTPGCAGKVFLFSWFLSFLKF
jgi:hypothetical protein